MAKQLPLSLGAAKEIVSEIRRRAIFAWPGRAATKARIRVVGSVRRCEPVALDLDFLVISEDPEGNALACLTLRPETKGDNVKLYKPKRLGPRYMTAWVRFKSRKISADFFLAHPAELPYALFHYTGDRVYNIRTRALAKKKGWTLNQYGLFVAGVPVRGSRGVRTEGDVARLLGVSVRTPRERVSRAPGLIGKPSI